MKNCSWIPIAFLAVVLGCSSSGKLQELNGFAPTEFLPEDTFLDNVTSKRALVIVAHDDDDCAMAGTIARLTSQGWEVSQLCLESHGVPGKPHPTELICKGSSLILEDRLYRQGMDSAIASYLPIPRAEIERQFLREKVSLALLQKVNQFKPSVIFTLDNVKGGYGHPDHIFISQLVLDLFQQKKIQPLRIYQSVYTDHMEKTIVDTWLKSRMEKWGYPHASDLANALYGIDGMPAPDVQVTITGQEVAKMKYLRAYPKEVRENLRKFIPYYEQVGAKKYFQLFDREFFRVIQ